MHNPDTHYGPRHHRQIGLGGAVVLEYAALLALVVILGAVVLAQVGGLLDTLVHEISIVA